MTTMFLLLIAGMAAQDVSATPKVALAGDGALPARTGQIDYVDFEAGAGYSTNPFLAVDSGSGRAFGRISAQVVHQRRSERSATSLTAYGENITYLGRYGSQQLLSVSGHHDESVDEKVRLFGDLNASLDRSGQLGTRFIAVPSFSPGTIVTTPALPDVQNVDVFVAGRTYRFSGQVGAQLTMSPRDRWTFRTGYSRSMLRGASIDTSYSDVFGSAAYDRELNERTSVGGILTARQLDYDGPGNVRVITPQVTGRMSLSQQTTLSGAIGVSLARIDDGTTITNSTGIAANASLCHTGQDGQFCASISRDQQTSSIGGPVRSTSASFSYGRKIDANQSLQFSLSAARSSPSVRSFVVPLTIGRSTYLNAAASYSRKLGSRWYSGLNVSTRKLNRDGPNPKPDVSGSIFLRYRLGDLG